jgi:hypothetical protein
MVSSLTTTPLQHQLLDLTKAQREPVIQPHAWAMICGGYRCPLYDDDAAVTTTDLGSDQATHQLDSAPARKANSGPLPILKP